MTDFASLSGRCLIAMPNMGDPRFERTLIYMCSHSDEGAMGLVVPVEMGRGFVLHSNDFHLEDATMRVDEEVSLTATLDVLRAMAEGDGPRRALIALGYSGWAPNQLEAELQRNGWLTVDADEELLFSRDDGAKWTLALSKLGVDPSLLSATGGTA
jgi:putative transcriptional regulator